MRDSSRSLTISGGGASASRNAFRSVASEPAGTRASLRSSLAPAGENRSRKRSSCLGLSANRPMPIPDFQTLMRPILEHAQMGEFRIGELIETLSDEFGLTAEERTAKVPSGGKTLIADRVHWAKTYLKQAGLLESPRRGHFIITDRGKAALSDPQVRIDSVFLNRYDEFRAFKTRRDDHSVNVQEVDNYKMDVTPEEALRAAHEQINESLAADLLDRVRKSSPAMFEILLVNLFVAMGYGGTTEEAGRALGACPRNSRR